jgi:C-terminal processing protease CtpA/Prc
MSCLTSKDQLSLSKHNRSSHHARGEFVSISVRKEDPKEKAGIRLEQDATGRLTVRNIARNGLFGDTNLEIGDVVLSINRVRLSDGEPPEALVEVANRATRNITVVVKKPNAPQTEPNEKMAKRIQKKMEIAQELVQDNNCTKADTYYNGLAKRNEDGTLNCTKDAQDQRRGTKMTVTISALKEDRDDLVGITFVVQNKKLWVAYMDPEHCIFADTDLQVGDCILSINDMSFREYVDAEYAETICGKARSQVTFVVVKNDDGFTTPKNPRPTKTSPSNQPPQRTSSCSSAGGGRRMKAPTSSQKQRTSSSSSISSRRSTRSNEDDDVDDDQVGPLRSVKGNKEKTLATASTTANRNRRIANLLDEDDTESLTTDESSTSSGHNNDSMPPSHKSNFKIEKYSEVNISAPKSYWKENVGVEFRIDAKLNMIYVHKILDGSIFERTSLEEGDYVLTINDVSFRGADPVDRRKAAKTCMQAKESVNLVVLKDESTYVQRAFNLDNSVTNLNWMVDSVRGGLLSCPPVSP